MSTSIIVDIVRGILNDSSAAELVVWANMKEDDAIARVHHGLGRHLRNKQGMWDEGSPCAKAFHKIGITHPDDMSSIILTCAHRILNNKPCDLAGQVAIHQKWWQTMENGGSIKLANGSTITFVVNGKDGTHHGNDEK